MLKFGTGGWRAIIGDEFTKANVQLLTAAVADKMKAENIANKGFVIGYDRRFLSEEASIWAAEVMAGAEIPCFTIRRAAPTPLIMYATKEYSLPYGFAITASHNPAIYNGIKVFMSGGRDADEAATLDIEKYIAARMGQPIPTMPYDKALRCGLIREIDPMNSYIDSIIRAVNMDVIRSRGLRVALDPMYGVSKTALSTILITARCDLELIHERRDPLFGGRLPAPNDKTLSKLRDFVLENDCDLGIATDGDADRLGIIDDEGQFLHPNKILVLLYDYLLTNKNWHGPVVRNVATTQLLDRIAQAKGEQCYEVPVGFKHITSKMLETGAVIGGESSGGLTVRGHISGKDGIYAASLLVEMIASTGKPLSQLYRDIEQKYGKLEMEERDYRFSAEKKQEVMDLLMVQHKLPNFPIKVEKVSYADGCKVYFGESGWIIARFSGTEPLLRIFCEAASSKEASELCSIMANFLGLE